jgi:hypothetical protein
MPSVEGNGMRLLGRHDLAGHGDCGEGIALLEHGGRRYLYLAHERGPVNFSVLDVTDPRAPELLAQTLLPHDDVRSNSLALGDGLLVVAYQVARPGLRPAGIEIFGLGRPAQPSPVGFLDLSGPHSRGTHWVGYTGGRYAFLSTGTADSRPASRLDGQFPVIVDLSEPGRPAEAGRWWLPGTQEGDGHAPPVRHQMFDSGFRAHNINVCPEPGPGLRRLPGRRRDHPGHRRRVRAAAGVPAGLPPADAGLHPYRPAPARAEPAGDQ